MDELMDLFPILLPLILLQLALFGYTLYHILTHDTYKHGTRLLWIAVSVLLMGFVGPILYFLLGREDS